MPAIDDYMCPACKTIFDTTHGRDSHLRQSSKCSWYRAGKIAEWAAYTIEELRDEPLEDVSRIVLDDRDLFHFIPPTVPPTDPSLAPLVDVDIGEAGPGPSTQAYRNTLPPEPDPDIYSRIIDEDTTAGHVVRMADKLHDLWRQRFSTGEGSIQDDGALPFAPFASEMDWRIAHWVITDNVGHASLDRLLAIPGVCESLGLSFHNTRSLHQNLDEIPLRAGSWSTKILRFRDRPDDAHLIRMRDPVEAVRSLWGDPTLAKHLVYRPQKIFDDAKRDNRFFSEMWTGDWWHTMQGRLPRGATVCPLILATDKTQLTNFSGGKSAYLVYLTIGNLPKSIRRKPSMHACVLIGYLSTDKVLGTDLSENETRARGQRVFHESMRVILESLVTAGKEGVEMVGGDGQVRRVYPILAAYVADFPEQCLVACSKFGTCPKCQCPSDKLQDPPTAPPRTPKWTTNIMEEAKADSPTAAQYYTRCMAREVSGGVYVPFWEDLPHTDIHTAITPDVLHQIYQGVFKHLVSWCQICITPEELDRRLRTLPPAFGGRHFENGISALSQVTGTDRKHIARALLGCLVGVMPPRGIRACRGVLDFMYYAQYKSHDDASLNEMQRALDLWESNKMFFVSDVPVREHLNIPKLHSLHHYISSIRLLGTTDNYNTEMFERLHIDFAKRGWRASNKRNAFPQMVAWLERQEKVMAFERYLTAVEPERPISVLHKKKKKKKSVTTITPLSFSVAKFPDRKAQKLASIESSHAAPGFSLRLKQLLNTLIPNPTSARRASTFTLPFDAVDVFHQFKIYPVSIDFDDDEVLSETIKATPRSRERPARFDTAIVLQADTADCASVEGTRVGRVKVLFTLPRTLDILGPCDAPAAWPKGPLAYVEWFTPFRQGPTEPHGFYLVKKMDPGGDGFVPGAIVPLSSIRQSCALTPQYGGRLDIASQALWTSDNVLDECESFLVNNWQYLYAYRTIW